MNSDPVEVRHEAMLALAEAYNVEGVLEFDEQSNPENYSTQVLTCMKLCHVGKREYHFPVGYAFTSVYFGDDKDGFITFMRDRFYERKRPMTGEGPFRRLVVGWSDAPKLHEVDRRLEQIIGAVLKSMKANAK